MWEKLHRWLVAQTLQRSIVSSNMKSLCCYNCPCLQLPRGQVPMGTLHVTFSLALLFKQQHHFFGTGARERGMRWQGPNSCKGDNRASNCSRMKTFFPPQLQVLYAHWCLWGWEISITSFSHSQVFQPPGGVSLWNKSCVCGKDSEAGLGSQEEKQPASFPSKK